MLCFLQDSCCNTATLFSWQNVKPSQIPIAWKNQHDKMQLAAPNPTVTAASVVFASYPVWESPCFNPPSLSSLSHVSPCFPLFHLISRRSPAKITHLSSIFEPNPPAPAARPRGTLMLCQVEMPAAPQGWRHHGCRTHVQGLFEMLHSPGLPGTCHDGWGRSSSIN